MYQKLDISSYHELIGAVLKEYPQAGFITALPEDKKYRETNWEFLNRIAARAGTLEYSKALKDSLKSAGFTEKEALNITQQATRQRVQYGLLGGEPVPRIPGRINQVK